MEGIWTLETLKHRNLYIFIKIPHKPEDIAIGFVACNSKWVEVLQYVRVFLIGKVQTDLSFRDQKNSLRSWSLSRPYIRSWEK